MEDKPQTEESESENDDYDPYTARNVPKSTNDTESMIHIIKGILGTGILAMPEAFKNSGLILGLAVTFGNCFLCTYAVHVFVNCLHMLCKKKRVPVLHYSEAMASSFRLGPPWARRRVALISNITDGFIITYQLGACCVYVIFVVVNMKSVMDVYLKQDLSIHVYFLLAIGPFFFINCWRTLKILVPFSIFSGFISILVLGTIYYYIFRTPLRHISELALFKIKTFPLAFGTTCFSFTSVPFTIAVENHMKTPQNFGGWFGVYNRSIIVILTVSLSIGLFGFWKFSEDTQPSIVLNFPEGALLTQCVTALYSFAIYISYSLNSYVPNKVLWKYYLKPLVEESSWMIIWEYSVRLVIVTVSVVLAATLPLLGLFMSLFGAIMISHLVFVFPGILDFCTRYPDNYGPYKFYKYRDIFFIVYGYFGLATGVSVGIDGVIKEFKKMYGK